jgi:hypothetical protein
MRLLSNSLVLAVGLLALSTAVQAKNEKVKAPPKEPQDEIEVVGHIPLTNGPVRPLVCPEPAMSADVLRCPILKLRFSAAVQSKLMQLRYLIIRLAVVGNRSVSPWTEKWSDFRSPDSLFWPQIARIGTRS